jgi:hypothetical protein
MNGIVSRGTIVPPVLAMKVMFAVPVEPELPELPDACMNVPSTVTILILSCSLG